MERVIVADDIAKRYGDTTALDGVSLSVAAGEVYALVGPNGAGKTTLVRALTGTATPDRGSIELFGDGPVEADTGRIAVLPQAFAPPERLTPHELVEYYAGLYDDARDPTAVLEEVGIDPEMDTWYENLSGGQQRRVTVATTLVNDPDLVFLDEPTTAIDPEGRHRLWELFEAIAGDGTTIFLTTHDMAEAERLADRVGLIADGRIVQEGAPSELIETYAGESRLIVETDASPATLNGFDARRTDDGLVVEGIDPVAIGDVVRQLESAGGGFDALSWREPTLEDAYLALADDAGDVEPTRTDRVQEVAQ
ncbi:MAG: ABC transporter ATP-binding protein [Halanaeroarchaeum sp.]